MSLGIKLELQEETTIRRLRGYDRRGASAAPVASTGGHLR